MEKNVTKFLIGIKFRTKKVQYKYIVVDLQQKLYNNSELEIVHIIWLEGE